MDHTQRPIYLDNNATTPMDPRVLEAMLPYLTDNFGNPSSQHFYGYESQKAVTAAREQIAALINCSPNEIYWTSGATESNNIAIAGTAKNFNPSDCHVITSRVEHKAVLEVVAELGHCGFATTILPPDENGRVAATDIERELRPNTKLVSVMAANNEIGTINPVEEIGELLNEQKITFHCDAVQALGKIPLDVKKTKIDVAAFSAHKLYGPKGVGALYVREGSKIKPMFSGGKQECGLRPGTLNVPAIVGFGKACEIAAAEMTGEKKRLEELRDFTFSQLRSIFPNIKLNGHPSQRLPGHLNVTLANVDLDDLCLELSEFAFSRGSACSGGKASYVLLALGLSPELAQRSMRIGFGRFNSQQDASQFVTKWRKIRAQNPSLLDPASVL